jgi:hypothetical protein
MSVIHIENQLACFCGTQLWLRRELRRLRCLRGTPARMKQVREIRLRAAQLRRESERFVQRLP